MGGAEVGGRPGPAAPSAEVAKEFRAEEPAEAGSVGRGWAARAGSVPPTRGGTEGASPRGRIRGSLWPVLSQRLLGSHSGGPTQVESRTPWNEGGSRGPDPCYAAVPGSPLTGAGPPEQVWEEGDPQDSTSSGDARTGRDPGGAVPQLLTRCARERPPLFQTRPGGRSGHRSVPLGGETSKSLWKTELKIHFGTNNAAVHIHKPRFPGTFRSPRPRVETGTPAASPTARGGAPRNPAAAPVERGAQRLPARPEFVRRQSLAVSRAFWEWGDARPAPG